MIGDPLVGRALGPYQIVERIGGGGMGNVYRAVHLTLEQPRAVKVLPQTLAADPAFVARFAREARLAARMSHPNIVQVHDVGEYQGIHYLVMALVEGESLADVVRREGRLPPVRVVRLLRQLAAALDAAHAVGIVHRDVKPSNAIVNDRDHLTLVDFGIARPLEGTRLTVAGAIGTPEYMAPELLEGREPGPGVDRYALGIVAYELLTGRVPFQSPSTPAIMYSQVHDQPPPPREFCPDLPADANMVVLRQLAKDPNGRFLTAGAFVNALASSLNVREAPSTAPIIPSTDAPIRRPAPSGVYPAPSVPTGGVPPGPPAPPNLPRSTSAYPQPRPPMVSPPGPPSGPSSGPTAGGPRRRPTITPLTIALGAAAVAAVLFLGTLAVTVGPSVYKTLVGASATATPVPRPTTAPTSPPTAVAQATVTPAPAPTATVAPPTATTAPAPSSTPVPPTTVARTPTTSGLATRPPATRPPGTPTPNVPRGIVRVMPDEGIDHVAEGEAITYQSRPPSSGTHYAPWKEEYGVFTEGIPAGYWVHNLEHGVIAILYNCPTGCPDVVQQLRDLYPRLPRGRNARLGSGRVLVFPYQDMETRIAAVAWTRLMHLDNVDADKLIDFVEQFIDRGPECRDLNCPKP